MGRLRPNLWKLPPPPARSVKTRLSGSSASPMGSVTDSMALSMASACFPSGTCHAITTMTMVRATASCAACRLSHSGYSTRERSQRANERCRWSREMSRSAPMENMRKAPLGRPLVVAMMTSSPAQAGATAIHALRQRNTAHEAR